MSEVGQVVYRRLDRALRSRIGVANLVGAATVTLYLFLSLGTQEDSGAGREGFEFFAFAPLLAVSIVVAHRRSRRSLDRACGWVREDRPPRPEERAATLAEPWRQAIIPFGVWLVAAAIITFVHVVAFDASLGHNLRTIDGILLGGITTAALAYLLVEGAFRPVIALALAGEPPERPSALGIRRRLLLAWAVGSGVPLLGLALSPVIHERTAIASHSASVVVLAVIGLTCGTLATLLVARSIAEPIDEVRQGLSRIQAGDLGVTVPVDDGGEIGDLQGGVNRMVAGLRERQQLQELFGRHVGTQVARHALVRGSALGGEQRRVSVLFVDLVGSTRLAQARPPAEVVATLNAFFATIVRVVDRQGGWVNEFEGDGALCVFGAPDDQPDHAARALRVARVLRGELEALALEYAGLDAGIGISSGTVVAGNVGAPERYEYTVIGDPVNEASRLTDEAKGRTGRVLASEHAIADAGDEADQWTPAGAVALRGRLGRTHVFEPSVPARASGGSGRQLPAESV